MSDANPRSSSRRDDEVGGGDETQLYFAADAVVRVLDDYLAALRAGQAPSRAELLSQHPELAKQLEACLAGLDFIHQAQATTQPHQKIGDFHIVREVGRGGMGAVYEAIQLSLGRRVALKILRFSPASDKEALERFKREAETVAALHHTSIVPIFFVGSENGVNYYAMQFIEGRNLAEIIADRDGGVPPMQVAAWGLQAAEALAHAHRRGVIHRDVKPSNLILDKEERLWLTDFGLARRLDDVTLSLTGMLLGTPRYMSPEHARASTKRIDHRSDIFSLGATLYELLTRTPAFPGDAAHDVIQHILVDEPTPIRQLNPAVPRDLETIVIKCLAKEPAARYASADDLAADLRAVLDDRPIRARRASPLELAGRWLKQNQRSVSQVSTAAMVTLAVTLTTLLGWTSYTSWKMSGIRLDAINPPLVAEILDQAGATVRTETLPMQDVGNLPAGQYDVRVSAEGTLSQTFDISLDRGHRDTKYTVNVADQWLVSPQPIEHSYDVFDTGSEQAIVLWGKDGITVHQKQGPPTSWSLTLSPSTTRALNDFPGYSNPRHANDIREYAFGATNESRPWVIHEPMDVNGDGVGDIICAARHQAWMMAISGNGQGVLWFSGRSRELSMTNAAKAQMNSYQTVQSSVLYPPLVCDDIDGDAVRDFVVAVASLDSGCDRWLEAISSRTGESIWRYDLPQELFALSQTEQVPLDLRWFHHLVGGRMTRGENVLWLGQRSLRSPPQLEQTGPHAYLPSAPQLLNLDGQPNVVLAAGNKLLLLDAKSGELRESPLELSFRPGNAFRWADVEGDNIPEMVALEEVVGLPSNPPDPKLVVWSLTKRKQLWAKQLDAYWPSKPGWSIAAPQWPLVTDLNGDGTCEIIVPDGRSHKSGSFMGGNASRAMPSGKIVVYDGATGVPRWTRTIATLDAEVDYFIDGPDLDEDGTHELFAATCDPNGANLYVDALSGATGKALWTASKPVPGEAQLDRFRIIALKWWYSGVDGWPQLAVSVTDRRAYSESFLNSSVLNFSAGTGALTSLGHEIAETLPVDLDRDGADDLIVCSNEIQSQDSRGSLHCIRGIARQPWKRLAALGEATTDINRDGVRDFVRSWGDGTLVATSGATGSELWRSRAVRATSELGVYAPDEWAAKSSHRKTHAISNDLNDDGFSDLVVFETHMFGRSKTPLHAISGRTGNLIWSMDDVTIQSLNGTLATRIVDMEQDGTPEVLWLAAVNYRYPQPARVFSNVDVQLWLFVVAGQTGRLRWAQPLSPAYGSLAGNSSPPMQFSTVSVDLVTEDINGDGVVEVVVPAVKDDGSLETRVLAGKDGTTLWTRSRQNDGLGQQSLEHWTPPTICDFEGDGRPELVLVEPYTLDATQANPQVEVAVTVLDAAGRPLWMKPTGSAFTHFSSYSNRKEQVSRPIAIGAARQPQVASEHSTVDSKRVPQPTSRVVVLLPSVPKLVSFDSTGASVERKLALSADLSASFAHDIDGDGQEELFFMDRGTIYATRADNLDEVLWERALGELGPKQILQVLAENDSFPPLVVARTDAASNTVLALDARSGRPVWTCPGPIARGFDSGTYFIHTNAALLGGAATEPPLVYFQYDFVNDCRQGMLTAIHTKASTTKASTTERTVNAWSQLAARGTNRLPAVVDGVKDDARWRRDLPWRMNFHADSRALLFLMWATFFAVTLIVIPASYITWLVSKRRYQMVHLLLLPVVAAIFIQAVLISAPDDNDFNTFFNRVSIAIAFSPPFVGLLLLARWTAQKRWRRIGMWMMVMLAVSFAIAAVSLGVAMRQAPLIENEAFDWTGWYLILWPGAYITSWFMVFSLPLERLAQWIWKRRRSSIHALQQPTGTDLKTEVSSMPIRGAPGTE